MAASVKNQPFSLFSAKGNAFHFGFFISMCTFVSIIVFKTKKIKTT